MAKEKMYRKLRTVPSLDFTQQPNGLLKSITKHFVIKRSSKCHTSYFSTINNNKNAVATLVPLTLDLK